MDKTVQKQKQLLNVQFMIVTEMHRQLTTK